MVKEKIRHTPRAILGGRAKLLFHQISAPGGGSTSPSPRRTKKHKSSSTHNGDMMAEAAAQSVTFD
jgi:hypothetical protein